MHPRPHTLAFLALLLPACAATDNNVGTVADGGGCPAPKVWRYEESGCDGQVQPICGQAGGDACLTVVCGCNGESLAGCDYFSGPYRTRGLCPGACFSPTHNLEVVFYGLVKGCACDPATDRPQCVPLTGGFVLNFTCAGGVWNATSSDSCSSGTSTGGNLGSGGMAGGSGGTSQTSQTGDTTSSLGGTDGGAPDAPQDLPGQAAQHPYAGSAAACANYPDAGIRSFPYNPSLQGDRQWPACTINCNFVVATAGAGRAMLDQALPDGPCNDEGATCDSPLMAGSCGPCTNTGGPGNGYTCVCRAQRWQCALVSVGSNACDPPRCLDPSLTIPYPQSCSEITWSATQVCGCGKCQDLCSSDSDCRSGYCNLNQVCRAPASCPDPYDCRASCSGICAPAPGDGGLVVEVGDAPLDAPADNGPDGEPVDSDGCPAPKVWRYEQVGCDGTVQPICGQAGGDGCLAFACACDGESLGGCDYFSKPYRSTGLCPGACLSPTHNLELLDLAPNLLPGCACDPATDKPQCVPIYSGTAAMNFTCVGGVWNIARATSCAPAPAIGAPCDVGVATSPSQGAYNSAAPECSTGLCIKPVVQSDAGSVDTGAFCTRQCSTDDDCSGGSTRDPGNPNDKTCTSGYTCGVAFVKGPICCQKLCLCKDFTGGAVQTPTACQGSSALTCNQ